MYESLDSATIERLKNLSNVERRGIISVHFSEGRTEEKGELDH
jgi:AraC family transcriptional regulator